MAQRGEDVAASGPRGGAGLHRPDEGAGQAAESAESDVLDAEWRLEKVFPWAQANPLRFALGCTPRWVRAGRPRASTVERSVLRSTIYAIQRVRDTLTEQIRRAAESEASVLTWTHQALGDVQRNVQDVLDCGAGLERTGGLS